MFRLRRDGMPLGTLVSFIKISSRSFIVDLKKPAFTLMAAVMIILTGVQTTGWSALITPRAIIVRTPLIGHEIDLSSALLREMQNNTALNDCVTSTSQSAFINTTVEAWNDTTIGASNIYFATMHSDCANPQFLNWTEAYTLADQPNYLSMIACLSQNDYSAWFGRDGLYQFMKMIFCSLSPKITNTSVTYSDVINVAIDTYSGGVAADVSRPTTFSAVTALYDMVYFSRAIVSNSMEDKVRALIQEVDGDTFTDNTTLRVMEEYIRGVTEYSASVLRACLSSSTDFSDALPYEIRLG
ncbi:hypothetical protein DFH08DRAFT_963010 [Mycena albidolilacea]|uniref:Uncharacterized protein n=1 Tax=Mycena albidolilacea TaxID=1033008 RepID=A0AAD7EQH1_9AGAR|nr:hypothetical protein DFH08DRAFT_963010 [Mycena albidolilacea]